MVGFTLIELLFVFSIFSILSTMGIASFVSFSRAQLLSAAAFDVSTMLQVAKSRAASQVIPVECGTDQLTGYKVLICGLSTSTCSMQQTFELRALCGTIPPVIQRKTLPIGITFDQSTTTSTSFLFHILSGAVDGPGIVTIKGAANSKKSIQVDTVGNVISADPASITPIPTPTP